MSEKQRRQLRVICAAAGLFLLLLTLDRTVVVPAVFEQRWLSLAVYLAPYLLCGAPVLRKAALGIKNRQPFDECLLMTIATAGAFAIGEYAEAVAVMVFYQVGEWFQNYAVGRSRRAITELMDIVPEYAYVQNPDGMVEAIEPDEVAVGDTLLIEPGQRIPVDGTVLSGESLIHTAALTGESVPRAVSAGEQVLSGCVNGDGSLYIRADKVSHLVIVFEACLVLLHEPPVFPVALFPDRQRHRSPAALVVKEFRYVCERIGAEKL